METIITLLIVLIPVAFKLIGKALEKASDTPEIPQRRIRPVSVDDSQVRTSSDARDGHMTKEVISSIPEIKEDKENKGNKIDPKKLVLYSEIMKPKF